MHDMSSRGWEGVKSGNVLLVPSLSLLQQIEFVINPTYTVKFSYTQDSFRVHGTRSDRYLFLFQKILLITKRKETGYSCKGTLMVRDYSVLV